MMFDRTLSLYEVHAFPYFLKQNKLKSLSWQTLFVSPLVPLVDLGAADHEHEGGDDGEVVGHQVCHA